MHNPERRQQFFRSFEAKSLRSRSFLTQIADDLTEICGSTSFFIFHIFLFSSWITVNSGLILGLPTFDPYPFGFLTMCVSLEAIFLAIFVLVSQNRQSYINTIREEVHLKVNLIAEEEITKILQVLAEMRREMGIKTKDMELEKMLERTDTNYIERSVVEQLQRANKSLMEQLAKEFPEILKYPVTKPLEIVQSIISDGQERSKKS
ncbi:hypothetical protein A3C32_01650 [Candidatus Daviesbacteria bacterium RIFCSPHIGHO2_02_FULL_41_14]|uniref:DUF1003 domain-containing protein n=1 Tax=Candidatus Daviesbacteria bacterium RIFCSPLOWO2_01_FULL_40_24 TaxID=1797787 RepID=A0A1F5MK13_9BACT|nr:MAG: hypothetical protein A2780_00905 [Candidatus Daviesbacteria bacterium RIFCSPHIGHO2_01_FULL_41_45]OGE34856.1 MAG: hypothetical protein A3C32_01650 [Candidatus Daviesbacteria bacterium RIFCSPHIGHO2_02_FULL_41_14]OGE65714.1 MAG: hypothetical protein A3B49_04075 [Candidatus Daviesbacteria bacterium RIFCSPLOWO2_01_FULL_40_24]